MSAEASMYLINQNSHRLRGITRRAAQLAGRVMPLVLNRIGVLQAICWGGFRRPGAENPSRSKAPKPKLGAPGVLPGCSLDAPWHPLVTSKKGFIGDLVAASRVKAASCRLELPTTPIKDAQLFPNCSISINRSLDRGHSRGGEESRSVFGIGRRGHKTASLPSFLFPSSFSNVGKHVKLHHVSSP
jgi:hypothetical protein